MRVGGGGRGGGFHAGSSESVCLYSDDGRIWASHHPTNCCKSGIGLNLVAQTVTAPTAPPETCLYEKREGPHVGDKDVPPLHKRGL